MKVCLATWAPFHAGAEVAALRLAVGLRDAGHQVSVIVGTRGETLSRMTEAGIRAAFVPLALTDKWRLWRYVRARKRLTTLLRELSPDVIHANDLPTSQMVAEAAGRNGIPRVCHHRWVFDGPAIDWLNKYGAERHLFVSRSLMDQLTAGSKRLATAHRAVVYDGLPIPPKISDEERHTARVELGLPHGKVIVTIAGQIIERKGHADLLHGWAKMPEQATTNAELVIVGDDLENAGEYRRQMEQLAGQLQVPARFVGFQKNVFTWLAASDIAVVPSHVEPLGNATLEAMALELPVIGCRTGGIPEMIVDGQTGLLVPPRSPEILATTLERMIIDEELRVRLGAAGRQRCSERFSLDGHVQSVLAEYEAVLQSAAV